ncbi:MAG: hypothetical protein ACUVWO_18035, partial [Thermodesulfobacteriota bacterium]
RVCQDSMTTPAYVEMRQVRKRFSVTRPGLINYFLKIQNSRISRIPLHTQITDKGANNMA